MVLEYLVVQQVLLDHFQVQVVQFDLATLDYLVGLYYQRFLAFLVVPLNLVVLEVQLGLVILIYLVVLVVQLVLLDQAHQNLLADNYNYSL
jgi:hypothetical protein